MVIERSSSIRPPAVPLRPSGTALGASTQHVFEVTGARRLSFDVAFPDDAPPVDGTMFDEVLLRSGEGIESRQLGRCRYEARGTIGRGGRLIPVESPLDCRELIRSGRVVGLDHGFDQLPLLLARKQAISPAFQRYTADLVYDLRIYRSLFDEIDAALVDESPPTRADVEAGIIEGQGRRFLRLFDERLVTLEEMARGFSRQEHERHGFYFRRHVWDAIMTSPFLARTNLRPRGYAGDSLMMQHIYENQYLGDSLFGKLLHKHPIESTAAQAVRNRRKMIAETIAEARRDPARAPGARLRFMSVACGPAWEVPDVIATAADCDAYECTLLDQDDEALGEAERRIAAVEARTGGRVQARYVRESVRTLLRAGDPAGDLGRYDVVYSMGLFDYLTAPVAQAVLGKLHALVAPGGRLIVGNFHVSSPTRWYMDYWMDWTLIYRTDAELLALARDLPDAEAAVSFEETGSQMFLSVRKAGT